MNIEELIASNQPIKLDMGCGYNKLPGFIGVDLDFVADDIVNCDMEKTPFPDKSVDFIFSSHALEHVGRYHTLPVLSEWKRILKDDGKMEIRVPDLKWCVESWLKQGCPVSWWQDTIFGNQEREHEYHRQGFTEQSMRDYLTQAGLKVESFTVIDSHSQPTMVFQVTKHEAT